MFVACENPWPFMDRIEVAMNGFIAMIEYPDISAKRKAYARRPHAGLQLDLYSRLNRSADGMARNNETPMLQIYGLTQNSRATARLFLSSVM